MAKLARIQHWLEMNDGRRGKEANKMVVMIDKEIN
jgi:hypothetical protein